MQSSFQLPVYDLKTGTSFTSYESAQGQLTRNFVSSSNMRLFFVANRTSSDFPRWALAFSALGSGK